MIGFRYFLAEFGPLFEIRYKLLYNVPCSNGAALSGIGRKYFRRILHLAIVKIWSDSFFLVFSIG